MRTTLICIVILLGAFAAYAYVHDPSDCEKLLNDAGSVVSSVSSVSPHPGAASQIFTLTQGKLISADGSPFSFPANVPVSSIQYYAIYYSAQWCPPCHAFTPVLVEWYKKFKSTHPNFELIFVSDDRNEAAMFAYMKEMAMPWPAVRFSDLRHDGKGIEKFAGSGIPDLVLVDADGKVLSDSFAWSGSYLGPQHVLDDIEKLVSSSGVAPVTPPPPAIAPIAPAPASTSAPASAPSPAPNPASASVSASAVPNPPPPPSKPWAPPDAMPAQPNWTWKSSDGRTYQNVVVTKIEPETVTITHSIGVAHIPISLLPPDIQKQLDYDPHAASQLTALISGKLVSADGTAATAPGASVQYYAIYYSAQWCPPCHAFTPRLVKWYNKFKPAHPNFELIFISEDHNETAMLDYMKEMAMPWLAVRFSDLQHDGRGTFKGSGIEKFAGNGIPDLVLVDTNGKVLSDSYQADTYVGPEVVVEGINKLLGGTSPVPLVRQTPSTSASRPALISAQESSTALGAPTGT